MKADLVRREPASRQRWARTGLYQRVMRARADAPRFVFHDGPPYANGPIHLGHLLNKCLKDFVVRSRVMMGQACPFVPGWDCHGLPIEHKVVAELAQRGPGEDLRRLPHDERQMHIRRACRAYAQQWVQVQREQMQRLLTLADYERPYLTMEPAYEAATLDVLATLVEQGLVYRALKPVHWSISNETALAEAELEYEDREDPSIYVAFEAERPEAVLEAFGTTPAQAGPNADRLAFLTWTTTPWTLPANLAIAVHPEATYALADVGQRLLVIAQEALARIAAVLRSGPLRVVGHARGQALVGLRYRHPFMPANRDLPAVALTIVAADYVTLGDGTGLVHTAPGHGEEDFHTGRRVGLPPYSPVRGDGTFDASVPEWLRGRNVFDANAPIIARLRESGHLVHAGTIVHSYPHDWRGKTPVIFRCTEQWFVSVDQPMRREQRSLRELARACVRRAAGEPGTPPGVDFIPAWGRNRLAGMLDTRPDWCISRQRAWGLPIPAFFAEDGTVLLTAASVRAVARVVREQGSDAWFRLTPAELLAGYDAASDPDCPSTLRRALPGACASLRKGTDILDVWFESGSSWYAVLYRPSNGRDFPADLYLEGSDQHRGWFQTSLLPALGVTGRPPYRAILTHGFIVDREGRKMSKSLGNVLEVDDLLREFGADVCRWWVASLSYEHDVRADRTFLNVAGDSYRKVRNTLRFMLANLADYPLPATPQPVRFGEVGPVPRPTDLEAWVLGEFDRVIARVIRGYETYDFQAAHRALYDLCNDTLSATYLAAIKDRLYCDRPDSPRRRRTQTALAILTDGLCRLLAPIMPHTADEAWRELWRCIDREEPTVHLQAFPKPLHVPADPGWAEVMAARSSALVALERAKAPPTEGGLGVENPLDAGVILPDPAGVLARFDPTDLADLLGVSEARVEAQAPGVRVLDLRQRPRCERSWKRDGTVRPRSDGGLLSDRDALALGL